MTRVGSLCTGYGGIELGLAVAGVDVDLRWLAEVDPALDPLHGDVANLGDITRVDWSAVEPVDLLTAGFPCQPVSAAGRQRGDADARWLWGHVWQAVAELQPTHVLVENVRNLISTRGGALWRGILSDLESLGYGVRWLTLGACHVGAAHHRHRVFALATMADAGVVRVPVSPCGAKGGTVLPTPRQRDWKGAETAATRAGRIERGTAHAGYDLPTSVVLLPTPQRSDAVRGHSTTHGGERGRRGEVGSLAGVGQLLPTPAARDGDARSRGEGDARYWAERAAHRTNGLPLGAAVALLPTPTVGDSRNSRNATAGRGADQGHHHSGTTLSDVSHGDAWGRFAEAVARHESLYGPAPAPTEPNRNGAPRLAPAFAEWLMCLPAGHVTAKLARVPALRAIGNGVCPPQLAAAWGLLHG